MFKPGEAIPQTGVYWCSVCKFPVILQLGQTFPECRNKCGRGHWEFIRALEGPDSTGADKAGPDAAGS